MNSTTNHIFRERGHPITVDYGIWHEISVPGTDRQCPGTKRNLDALNKVDANRPDTDVFYGQFDKPNGTFSA